MFLWFLHAFTASPGSSKTFYCLLHLLVQLQSLGDYIPMMKMTENKQDIQKRATCCNKDLYLTTVLVPKNSFNQL